MKKLLFLVIVSTVLFFGCGERLKEIEADYVIKVTGTAGLSFKGNCSFVGLTELPSRKQTQGTIPAEYTGKGITTLCMFRNTGSTGTMKVEVFKNNQSIEATETSDPYGVVTIGKMPDGEGIMNTVISKILDFFKL